MKITIAGLSGAGKTSLLKKLAEYYGTKPISIGDLRGEFAIKNNTDLDGLNKLREKDSTVDTRFDIYQREYMEKEKKFTIEGRVSYFFAPKDSINLFLVADRLIRAKRIFEDPRKDEKKCNSLQEILEMLDERTSSDIKTYWNLYKTNCYDATNFHLAIDTTFQTEEQVFFQTLQKIGFHKELIEKYKLH